MEKLLNIRVLGNAVNACLNASRLARFLI